MRSIMRSFVLLSACVSALVMTACHDDEICNPGLELKDGVCVPSVEAAPVDAAAPDAGVGDTGPAGD